MHGNRERPSSPIRPGMARPDHQTANQFTILLIDNEEYSIFYRELMKQWGYRVEQAKDIKGGRRALESLHPDLIMLGDTLSDGNSFEFCKELRKQTNIPVVLIDCHKAEIRICKGLEAGASDYFPKHHSFEFVCNRLESILEPTIKYKT